MTPDYDAMLVAGVCGLMSSGKSAREIRLAVEGCILGAEAVLGIRGEPQ